MMRKRVVSLSGGKDSTAMLLMLLERGERVDEVVMFDTGMEFPEMYDHISKLEEYTGLEFTKLRMEPSFEHLMFVRRMKWGKRQWQNGYGWPRPNARWCTGYKTRAIDRHMKKLGDAEVCIGIAADETHRRLQPPPRRYPLVEWNVTERQALEYCKERGFDWGGSTRGRRGFPAGAARSNPSKTSGPSGTCTRSYGRGCATWNRSHTTRSASTTTWSSWKSASPTRTGR